MKKVLIIANLFHASPRIPGLTNHFLDIGWDPTIITVPLIEDSRKRLKLPEGFLNNVKIIETEYSGDIFCSLRNILKYLGFSSEKSLLTQAKVKTGLKSKKSLIDFLFKAYTTFFAYPDEEKKWRRYAYKSACDILDKEKFDIIVSSSSPVTAHIVASKLKEKYNIPWVADMRDLWTQNHRYPYLKIRKIFEKRLETKTLKTADALITVSMPLVENLKKLYKNKPVFEITNGFEPDIINDPLSKISDKFTIIYSGQIYDGKQDPIKLLIALRDLIREKIIDSKDLEVDFYGLEKGWLNDKIKMYNLSENVRQRGFISRSDVIKIQHQSQILLKLNWEDPSHKGGYSGKIFEYLAAKRPILATGGFKGDVTKELLNKTNAGVFAPSVEDVKKAIRDFYSEFKSAGQVIYRGDWNEVNKFNYNSLAKQFAYILDNVLKN